MKLITLSKHLILLLLSCFLAQNVWAGDLNIELGDSVGVVPKGAYMDALDRADLSKSFRYALKYTFDSGLVLGREEFNSASSITDSTGNAHLFVTLKGFTAGWAIGDKYRLIAEVGIPEQGTVSRGADLISIMNRSTSKSQDVDSQWYGASLDWGVLNEKGEGWGILIALRQVSLKTDNLFDTNTDFDGSGLYFTGAFRYRL